MGSGASKQALLQRSGSRIDALLAEAAGVKAENDDERLLGVTLARIPPGIRAEMCNLQRPSTERARPYVEQWCHEATAELPAVDDIPADVADEKTGRDVEAEEEEDESYSTDDFEDDEVTEWKKGASIGAGSYGTVYLARDEDTGCLMAVKEILISEETDSAIREATREVELLRSLKHENIVKYLGCHVDNLAQTLSIFTEWVPGGSLEHNRKLFGGNERVVRRFTHQLLSGVAYLHSKKIIHHDIKPANILVDQNGVVKIADFGSSRLINSATMANASSRSLHGTPNYMAPEVIKQTSGRNRKADIWSIGCTVLRLLTGRPLWGDRHFDSQAALLYYIANLEQLPPLPQSLSPEAREFILACLQIDPAMRPSAAELLEFPFAQYAGHRAEPVAPEPVTTTTPRRHTAPVVPSPPVSPSHRPRRSERRHETPKEAKSSINVSPASQTRRASLVATLFSPADVITEPREDAPENEAAGVESVVNALTPPNCSSEVTHTSRFTLEDSTTRPGNNEDLLGVTRWDERPITAAAARKEREKYEAELAEASRRNQERQRRYQEEVAAYIHESFAGRS
ncbi:hypothetical protein PF005_g11845 [Phytophthora fragariae]|uniref:Protein kinase domain-containing protein n=1 Tax=Phytophthora fragariae TaxID=53985 RepID=A0A6A3XW65_9STRA|nr:hypothetical protein PF003_g14494 [Phytophthora fragariae]KAE8936608.1 hypothetical protein PF009_g13473 [Phytophthora fragariae]KAE9109880.1 hypothetical protein PF007_g12081 [Phytophthora fragariae]KAE9144009.1 hypothetical protein PF006_g11012 [Phytophthora fragariae]KAE9209379.1 hypothetical protein PF005_g11845 [Phytophthora fragariae]